MGIQVLDAVRDKFPQCANVDDPTLTAAIATKYPQYLQNPEFAKAAAPMLQAAGIPFRPPITSADVPPNPNLVDTTAGGKPVAFGGGSVLPESDYAESGKIIPTTPQEALTAPSVWAQRGGKFLLGAMADLASTATGTPSAANMESYANTPGEPMPVESGIAEMHGLGSVPTKAAAGLIQMVPALGVSGGAAMAGAPAAAASALPMLANQEGQIDPYGAMIAAGLPGVSGYAEKYVGAQLAKLPTAHVVAEVLSRDPLQIKAKVVQRLGGLEISNDVFRKYLEAGGGAVAANAYLLASQTPQILALPSDQRGEAIMDNVAGNLATSMLAFSSRPGTSETLKALRPKLQELWARTQADRAVGGAPGAEPPGGAPGETPASPSPTDLSTLPNVPTPAAPAAPGKPMVPPVAPTPVSPPPTVQPPVVPTPPAPESNDKEDEPPAANGETPITPPVESPQPATPIPAELPPTAAPSPAAPSGHPGNNIADMVKSRLQDGQTVTPQQVKDYGAQLGLDDRQAGEWAELGATEHARDIAQNPQMTDREKFHALVNLYERMPTNGTRTVETKVNQQYSTPPPLAFVGGVLADLKGGNTLVEPTAGHGMLTIGANWGGKINLNEMDAQRQQRLVRFVKNGMTAGSNVGVTGLDATGPQYQAAIAGAQPDRVAMNPPFGNVLQSDGTMKKFPVPAAAVHNKETTSLDTSIMLNTFNALTKDGKGFAIIGAKTGTPLASVFGTDKERAADYKKPLFLDLFHRFNVVDWFTIGGDLYRKMGAAWPVDMVVVHGKSKTPGTEAGGLARPWVKPPRVITSWEELAKLIPQNELDAIKTGGPGSPRAGGSLGGTYVGAGSARPERPGTPEVSNARPERPAPVGVPGRVGDSILDVGQPNPTPQPPPQLDGSPGADIGQGPAKPADDVAKGGAEAGTPRPPGVGGAGKVPARPGKADAVGHGLKPSAPTEGLPASLMVPYKGTSKGYSLNLVAPRNIADQMQKALADLQTETGMSVDEYAAAKLSRDVKTLHSQLAGAQIDTLALAIRDIERGSALICAHETGVGKGRVVAALIEYARSRGLVPVFVTAKPNLYSDMVGRDLPAVGNKGFKPFITNTGYVYEDGHGNEVKGRGTAAARNDEMQGIIRTGQLPGGAHGVFTTYDQLKADKPAGFSETPKEKFKRQNQHRAKPDGIRFAMLRAIAPRAIFILDEAHQASGPTSDINLKMKEILPKASGIYYSSATFAKRPDNLGLYALGTLMKKSGLNDEQMTEALTKGGVPLQQALTSMLAESGELMRVQQDWTGVQMKFVKTGGTNEIEAADTYTSFLRDLMTLADQLNAVGAGLENSDNQVRADEAKVKVEDVNFGSRLFALSNQYLFALRAGSVVDLSVSELKAGRKPFIHVHNTLEGPMGDLKTRKLPLNFGGLLRREMQKMLTLTVRDPMEESGKKQVEVQPEDLPDGGKFYYQMEKEIGATDWSGFPISPIDHIKNGIKAAGYSCGEITARDGEVDDSGAEVTITKREKQERGKVLKNYNDGLTDVLLINGSGGTGLSAHADPKFKDQRQRSYIEGQPAPDINEEMQALGRVMRSGQTSKPVFIFPTTLLAAERRFATMLRGKMTSLNASTTAEGESGMTQDKNFAADIFNTVGDDVVFRVMEANDDIAKQLDLDVAGGAAEEGFARKATGNFPLLPNADADRLWNEIAEEYQEEIARLDEAGENPLKATAEDLQAQTKDTSELQAGTGNTVFDGPVNLERCEVKPPKAPPTHAEARQRASDNLPTIKAQVREWIGQSRAAEAERVNTAAARGAKPEQLDRIKQNFENVRLAVVEAARKIGDTFGVDVYGDGSSAYYGVAAEMKLAGSAVSHFASASRQHLILTTNTFRGRQTIPLSKLYKAGAEQSYLVPMDDEDEAAEQFDKTAESNAERHIITGNLLRGWDMADDATRGQEVGRPRVAIYTKADGSLNTGILMPAAWQPGVEGATELVNDADAFTAAVRGGKALRSLPTSSVHPVVVKGYTLGVPSSGQGRLLWADPQFKGFFNSPPQQTSGAFIGTLSDNRLPALFNFLQSKGVRLATAPGGETAAMSSAGSRENTTSMARGAFVSGAKTGPGKVPLTVTYGGMKFVHPLALPELVRLVRNLTGNVPAVRKLPQRGNQKTYGTFGDGMITLDPLIFKDPAQAGAVLAHELGHLVDYLPHETLKRGNLLGHLQALTGWLKQNFGALNNKELKNELLAVTKWWRPYDEANDPPTYVKYRQSPEELYADAVSVLFNCPAELEARAPKFYKAFWGALGQRPAVEASLFAIQDMLNTGMLHTAATREAELRENFRAGEAIWKNAVANRQKMAASFDGWWESLAQELYWEHYPMERRAATVEKRGVTLAPGKDPRHFLDDYGYRNTTVMAWGRHIFEKVLQPLEAAGLTIEDAGLYLFYKRIMDGDRAQLANSEGHTPDTARLGLLKMRLDLGMGKMTILEHHIQIFHDDVFKLAKQAVQCGAYNRQTFQTVIAPNRNSYATFAVLEYLDDYLPPGIQQQVGTLKATANSFPATILKSIGVINLIAAQQAKNKTVDFLQQYFADEITKAGDTHPTVRKGKGIFKRLENGRPAFYYVDPYIAKEFEARPSTLLWSLVKPVDWAFRKLVYPFIITYNPAFLYMMQPGRDLQRTARNLPGVRVTAAAQVPNYLRNLPNMPGRFNGQPSDIIREMEANLGIASPFDMITRGHRDDFMGDLMRKMSVLPSGTAKGFFNNPLLAPVRAVLDRMEFGGNVLIDLSKVAAYTQLRKQGLTPQQAAYWTRNYAGIPNLNKRGLLLKQVRALVPFWNVFLQGWRADAHLATDPTTRSGWWFRYMAGNGMLRCLIAAAAMGALSAALKELYDGIPSYDLANYLCIPIGWKAGGAFGRRVVYLRIPEDFTGRMIGGMISKGASHWSGRDANWGEMLSFGAGQFPEFNPAVTLPEQWAQFALAGHNPTDDFRGEPIISDKAFTVFKAGVSPVPAAGEMAHWTLNQSGVLNLFNYNPQANNTTELALSAVPGVNKFIKVSDGGFREAQRATQTEITAQRDMQELQLPAPVQALELEYWRLARINKDARTDAQNDRLSDLRLWYRNTYRPAMSDIGDAVADKNPAEAAALRSALDKDSAEYYPKRK